MAASRRLATAALTLLKPSASRARSSFAYSPLLANSLAKLSLAVHNSIVPFNFSTVAASRHFHSSARFCSAAADSNAKSNPFVIDRLDYTEMAWEGLLGSFDAMKEKKADHVETEHLMKALLVQKDGLARRIFIKAGIDNNSVLQATNEFIAKQPTVENLENSGKLRMGKHMVKLFESARSIKGSFQQWKLSPVEDDLVSVEHFILAFCFDKRFGERLFTSLGIGWMGLRAAIDPITKSRHRELMNRIPSLEEEVDRSHFTEMAFEVMVEDPIDVAEQSEAEVVETEHLMKALLQKEDGLALRIFRRAGLDNISILEATEDFISKQPKVPAGESRGLSYGPHFVALVEVNALKLRKDMKDEFVSVEHFILALYSDERFGQQLFRNLGLSEKGLRDAIEAVRESQKRESSEHWGMEKELMNEIGSLKEEIEAAEGAATLISLRPRLENAEEHLAAVESKWTRTHFEDFLQERVPGQDTAVESVADAIRRSRAGGLSHPNGPLATFMFLGPADVGKRGLGESLADYLFLKENALVCIAMDEYMEEHAVPRLVGLLTGVVSRRQHGCVILFEEIEKAHQDVLDTLLQVLDDGEISDCQGRAVSFRNTVIIMTSNIGSDLIKDTTLSSDALDAMKEQVVDLARQTFRPEFMNRINEYTVFKPLDDSVVTHIHRDTDGFRI